MLCQSIGSAASISGTPHRLLDPPRCLHAVHPRALCSSGFSSPLCFRQRGRAVRSWRERRQQDAREALQNCSHPRLSTALRPCVATAAAAGGAEAGSPAGNAAAAGPIPGQGIGRLWGRKPRQRMEERILGGILSLSEVPFSSYVSEPRTFLHSLHGLVKEVWLFGALVLLQQSGSGMRAAIAAFFALISVLALPRRLWRAQLPKLLWLAGLIFVLMALNSDVPGVLQPRAPPPALEGLPPVPDPAVPYRYTILRLPFLTVTRRSIALAVAAASLTFTSLQAASLVLITTPPEQIALALRTLLFPLRLLGVGVGRLAFSLLLALRFLSLVFEEVRGLCLGLAVRGVDWAALGPAGGYMVPLKLMGKLFRNLEQRAEGIAVAMTVRGFAGPEAHHVHMASVYPSSPIGNALALLALVGLWTATTYFK